MRHLRGLRRWNPRVYARLIVRSLAGHGLAGVLEHQPPQRTSSRIQPSEGPAVSKSETPVLHSHAETP